MGGTRSTEGTFRVSGATLANGSWVVSRIEGQMVDKASRLGACAPMHLVTALSGAPSGH